MPVVPIYLNIDEKTYAGVKAGALELCGMAKILITNGLLNTSLRLLMLLKNVQAKPLISSGSIRKER
jgi:hypothetical protein